MNEVFRRMLERMEILKEKKENYRPLLHKFKEEVERLLGRGVRVLVFGSVAEGRDGATSDVDVMVIAEEFAELDARLRTYAVARKVFGVPHPFELHLITPKEFEGWYGRFISKYEEIF